MGCYEALERVRVCGMDACKVGCHPMPHKSTARGVPYLVELQQRLPSVLTLVSSTTTGFEASASSSA
eukprot:3672989-Amphidinium_carterae.1